MKLTIITASHQANSLSARVGEYIESELKKASHTVNSFSLRSINLPLWTPEVYKNEEVLNKWNAVREALTISDGFVFVTPEYHGMASPQLKNFFLYAGAKELAHKAAIITSTSTGIGGSYPINELRASSYKNSRICYVPDHIIVRYGGEVLKNEKPSGESDIITRKRIAHGLQVLCAYSQFLTAMRAKHNLVHKEFPNGM